ncbi:MAG: FAD-binding oxidoreductase [Eubacteriales bacterium]|nr:FAD-binding oxidoreductase [Eubacteriales bacterium]
MRERIEELLLAGDQGSETSAKKLGPARILSDESMLEGELAANFVVSSSSSLATFLKEKKDQSLSYQAYASLTSLTAAAVPSEDAELIGIDFSSFNQCLSLEDYAGQPCLLADAGCTIEEVEAFLKTKGYRLPFRPSETNASLGGVVSNGAAGGSLQGGRSEKEALLDSLIGVLALTAEGETVLLSKQSEIKAAEVVGSEGEFLFFIRFLFLLEAIPAFSWQLFFTFEQKENLYSFWAERLEQKMPELVQLDFISAEIVKIYNAEKGSVSELKDLPNIAGEGPALYLVLESEDEARLENALVTLLESFLALGEAEENTIAAETEAERRNFQKMRHGLVTLLLEKLRKAPPLAHLDCILPPEELLKQVLEAGIEEPYLLLHCLSGRIHLFELLQTAEARAEFTQKELRAAKKSFEIYAEWKNENGVGRMKRELWEQFSSEKQRKRRAELKQHFDPNGKL